jgi:polyisoprenoid-binding protein YceI
MLSGRFDYFVLQKLHFDEANPQNISFSGYVWLDSVNTSEPGRDEGCLLGTYGTDAAKTTETENLATVVSKPSTGRYSSVDEGFLIDADFTFHGVTKEVTVKFFFYPQADIGTQFMTGISAEYAFNALTDYGVSSTNIGDKVTVKINTLLKYKKP